MFAALADPHRLRILFALARAEAEVCVCDLTESLPINQPTVSHHLKILKDAGLVGCVKRGTWCYYALAPGVRSLLQSALEKVLPHKAA